MADVVVDATPKPQLPYDPDDIPDSVKKRVAAVEALYQSNGSGGEQQQPSGTPEPPKEAPAPQTPESVQPPSTAPVPASAEPSPSPPDDDESWKHRYYRMQGQWTASQKTIGELQEQMTQLGNELLHAQRFVSQPTRAAAQQPPPSYLTEQDVQNYGNELVDFAQRAAVHAVSPQLQNLEQQNEDLRQRLAREARRSLDQAVELAVPNYREIDRNPRWHHWLLGIDVLSGRVRQQLLDEAISAAAAPRVISFFRGFLAEEVATGHNESAPNSHRAAPPREAAVPLASLAAPGRARPATGADAPGFTDKPIYTRAQIAELYNLKRKNAFVGREAEWARQEADIFAAQREGRVRT